MGLQFPEVWRNKDPADVRDVGGALGHMSGELDQTECGLCKGLPASWAATSVNRSSDENRCRDGNRGRDETRGRDDVLSTGDTEVSTPGFTSALSMESHSHQGQHGYPDFATKAPASPANKWQSHIQTRTLTSKAI